jgi:hypothetical protein
VPPGILPVSGGAVNGLSYQYPISKILPTALLDQWMEKDLAQVYQSLWTLRPPPELGGKVWCKNRDHKNDRPDVAVLERLRLEQDLPGLALPQAERELEDERKDKPAQANAHEHSGAAGTHPRQ